MTSVSTLILLFLSLSSLPFTIVLGDVCVREYDEHLHTTLLGHQYLNQYWKCECDPDQGIFPSGLSGLVTPWIAYDVTHGEYAMYTESQVQHDANAQCSVFADTPFAVSSTQGYGAIIHQISGDVTDFSERLRDLCVFHGFGGMFTDYCVPSQSACAIPNNKECIAAGNAHAIDLTYGSEPCDGIFESTESREAFWQWRKTVNATQFALSKLCIFDSFYVCHATPLTAPNLQEWQVLDIPYNGQPVYVLKEPLVAPATAPFLFFLLTFVGRRRRLAGGDLYSDPCTFFIGQDVENSIRNGHTNDFITVTLINDRISVIIDGIQYSLLITEEAETIGFGISFAEKLLTVHVEDKISAFYFSDSYFHYNAVEYAVTVARQCKHSLSADQSAQAITTANRIWSDEFFTVDSTKFGPYYNRLRVLSDVWRKHTAFAVIVAGHTQAMVVFDPSTRAVSVTAALDPTTTNAAPYTNVSACALVFAPNLLAALSTGNNGYYYSIDFVGGDDSGAGTPITQIRAVSYNGTAYHEQIFAPVIDTITAAVPVNEFTFGSSTQSAGSLYIQAYDGSIAYGNPTKVWSDVSPSTSVNLQIGLLCTSGIDVYIQATDPMSID